MRFFIEIFLFAARVNIIAISLLDAIFFASAQFHIWTTSFPRRIFDSIFFAQYSRAFPV